MKRWVCFEMPVMVVVEVDDHEKHEEVTKVVLSTEEIDLARDDRGHFLVYDESMERVHSDTQENVHALTLATCQDTWPERHLWEEGADPRAWPGLYDGDEDLEEDDFEDLEDEG